MADETNTPSKRAAKQAKQTPVMPLSQFNFNELLNVTSVPKIRRARYAAAASITAAVAVTGTGLLFRANAASLERDRDRLDAQTVEYAAETAELVGGDYRIPEHVSTRETELGTATATDVQPSAALDVVLATTPEGVTIVSVAVSEPTDSTEGDQPPVLTIEANVTDLDLIRRWRDNLAASPFVAVTPESLTANAGQGTATMTVDLIGTPGGSQ